MITKLRRLKTLAIVAGVLFAGAMYSCDDEPGQVGKDLIQQGETVTLGEDSDFTPKSYTYTHDVIRTDNEGTRILLLGSYNDTIYGRVTAGYAAQFRLQSKPDFGESPKPDSVILVMPYQRIYGDTITKHKLKIYELTGDLNPDTKYDSNTDLTALIGDKPLVEYSFEAKHDTSKNENGSITTKMQYLTVKLGKEFATKLMNIPEEYVGDNDLFLQKFKGLYLEVEEQTTDGSLLVIKDSFSDGNGGTNVAYPFVNLYYHNVKDTTIFSYGTSVNSAIVSTFKHDYSGTDFEENLNKDNVQDTVVYIQPTGGLRSKIVIEELNRWKEKKDIQIDKASITFYVDTTLTGYNSIDNFKSRGLPSSLLLEYIDENGDAKRLADTEKSASYVGGSIQQVNNIDGKIDYFQYEFRITHHLQKIVKGEIENNGFFLSNPAPGYSYNGVVLKGADSSRGIKVKVLYSKIE
ncbi:DUF4270 family protein [Prolixibacteraceae bacterium JC049]|nr:DUF4270 family protein [Prolixibacteraceae bacterium JC049]